MYENSTVIGSRSDFDFPSTSGLCNCSAMAMNVVNASESERLRVFNEDCWWTKGIEGCAQMRPPSVAAEISYANQSLLFLPLHQQFRKCDDLNACNHGGSEAGLYQHWWKSASVCLGLGSSVRPACLWCRQQYRVMGSFGMLLFTKIPETSLYNVLG